MNRPFEYMARADVLGGYTAIQSGKIQCNYSTDGPNSRASKEIDHRAPYGWLEGSRPQTEPWTLSHRLEATRPDQTHHRWR